MIDEIPQRPFTRAEARALGVSDWRLSELVAEGVVHRVLRGVYRPATLPDTLTIRATCALLVLPDHAVVTDRSASWLHGIDSLDPTALDIPPVLEVVSVDGHDRTRLDGTLGGKRALLPEDITMVNGVRVTTPLRTAADLACLRGRFAALAALDAFMRRFGLSKRDFERLLVRYVGRRGVVQFRELVQYADPASESAGESWTRMAIIDAGLPVPKLQVTVLIDGYGKVRIDLSYPSLKIAVEYDGEEFHTSDQDQAHDARRRKAMRDAGWIVIVVDKRSFSQLALDEWLLELRQAIADRSPNWRRQYARGERLPRRRARG